MKHQPIAARVAQRLTFMFASLILTTLLVGFSIRMLLRLFP